jgi:hypothetical protein
MVNVSRIEPGIAASNAPNLGTLSQGSLGRRTVIGALAEMYVMRMHMDEAIR